MKNYFLTKAKYQRVDEQGRDKKVTEHYLVDAVTFIEAETRINEELEPYITGDFAVTACKISNISEIIQNEEKDDYYKCKISLITLDEEAGVEKRKNIYFLVQADNVKDAYDIIIETLGGTISDYEILGIDKSPILDIFNYSDEVKEEDESKA